MEHELTTKSGAGASHPSTGSGSPATQPAPVHLPRKQLTKAKWFKNIKAAIDAVGLPSESISDWAHLRVVYDKCEELDRKARLEERGTLDRETAYVTDAGKECGRALYYSYTNTEVSDPIDLTGRIKMDMGNAAGELFAKRYRQAGVDVKEEEHVAFDVAYQGQTVRVTGRIDYHIEDEDKVIELKSTASDSFKWLIARKEPGRTEHRTQLNLYLHRKNLDGLNYRFGILRYLLIDAPKGTPNPLSFKVEYDAAKAEADLQRLARIWVESKAGKDPGIPDWAFDEYTREGKIPLFPCSYCGHKTTCWAATKAVKQSA